MSGVIDFGRPNGVLRLFDERVSQRLDLRTDIGHLVGRRFGFPRHRTQGLGDRLIAGFAERRLDLRRAQST